jgi:O-antigen/teichoic acid export membrane protein
LAARLDRAFSLKAVRKETLRALLAFSLPLIPGTILWWIISVSDRYLLTYFSGGEINGLYVAAAKIPTLLTILCTVFLTAWKISAVVEDSGDDREAVREKSRFYSRVYRGFIAVLFSMASGIILFSKLFARILFAESYYTAWAFIPILTVGTVFYSLSRFLGSVYFVKRKSLQVSLTAGASAVLNVVLNLILIPHLGGFGAAVATFAAYFLEFVIRDVNSKHYLSFNTHRWSVLLATVLLGLNAVVVSLEIPYWLPCSLFLTALMLAVQGRALLAMAKGLLQIIRSKKVYK